MLRKAATQLINSIVAISKQRQNGFPSAMLYCPVKKLNRRWGESMNIGQIYTGIHAG